MLLKACIDSFEYVCICVVCVCACVCVCICAYLCACVSVACTIAACINGLEHVHADCICAYEKGVGQDFQEMIMDISSVDSLLNFN